MNGSIKPNSLKTAPAVAVLHLESVVALCFRANAKVIYQHETAATLREQMKL